MIVQPTDRLWTAEEIEGFRPLVEAWTIDDVETFYNGGGASGATAMTNTISFHKVYKGQVRTILLATPHERLAKIGRIKIPLESR